jgi:hypothetical protein
MTGFSELDDRSLELPLDILRSMIGGRIQQVGYKTSAVDADLGSSVLFHEVDHAVTISTGSATMVLEWCIRGYDEFLNIVAAPEDGKSAIVVPIVDVTGSPAWSALTESPILSFGVASHESEGGSELPWALRINLQGGASLVVALGEIRDAVPSYQPDSLLVIFDPEMAQSFQILDAADSAWGRELRLER